MKEETKNAIREKDLPYRQNMLRFLYSTMTATEFADAFWSKDEDGWSDDAEEIAAAFEADLPEPEPYEMPEADAVRLHELICEGDRQGAIDLLNEITGGNHRSVAAQRNLFPDRIPA